MPEGLYLIEETTTKCGMSGWEIAQCICLTLGCIYAAVYLIKYLIYLKQKH